MSSPPRRRHELAPMEETQGSVRTKRQRLPELDAPAAAAANEGSRASSAETEDQTCEEGDICRVSPKTRQGLPELDKLPEDMLQHIHSLLPLQDAARAACVSRRFVRSWRCYSNLILDRSTLGLTDNEGSEIRYINKIDRILNSYSGSGMKVKTLRIDLFRCKTLSAPCLDRWLRIAVKSEINELKLSPPYSMKEKYSFPHSLLFDDTGTSSVQFLYLFDCIFGPIETLGCFSRMKRLNLVSVHITEEGLQQLLSKSSGLERLEINSCSKMISLKIPCTLQMLKFLKVTNPHKMKVVDISAPNLSSFHYCGFPLEISIRDPSQLKDVYLKSFGPSGALSYGRAKLPSIAPNVESLTLLSSGENVNTLMLPSKLLHLKSLTIKLHRSRESFYDIFSVISFLDASPALESFILHAERDAIIRDCVYRGDDLYLMGESIYQYGRLRRVKITGFCSAKSMIKLVIHILERAPSLDALTLDTTRGCGRKPGDTSKCNPSGESGKCSFMSKRDVEDANSAVEASGRYIVERVPSAVEFEVLEPCRRCHHGNQPADEAGGICLKQHAGVGC